jgi:CAAX protease family protein
VFVVAALTQSILMADDSQQPSPLETSPAAHLAALAFAMSLPTVATLLYFVLLSGSPWMKVVYFGSKVVQFAFPLVWVLAVQRRRVRLTPPDARSIGPGLLVGLLIVAAGLGAYFGDLKSSPYLQRAPELIGLKVADMGLTSPTLYITFALFLAVPHSLLEEYYWRWFVFGQLRRVTPFAVALSLSSLGFMAHHVIVIHQFLQQRWGVTLFFSLCVAVGGGLWAWLYERNRSLYGPWFSHLLVDCGIMYIGYDLIPWP